MVNLRAVAKRAAVSISTASKVLNNSDVSIAISGKTKLRVQQAARDLGYLPNAAARALRRQEFRTLGVLGSGPDFFRIRPETRDFNTEAIRGLMDGAVKRGYHVILLSGMETKPEAGGAFADCGMADGLMIINRDLSVQDAYLSSLHQSGKPVMYVLDYPPNADVFASFPDDSQGGGLATKALLEAGCKKIGLVRKSQYKSIFDKREDGWRRALGSAGFSISNDLIIDIEHLDITQLKQQGIDGVLCLNNSILRQFANKASQEGLSIPSDIQVVAFGHDDKIPTQSNQFAMVVEPLAEIVEDAVHRLVDILEGKPITEKQRAFQYSYIQGASVRNSLL